MSRSNRLRAARRLLPFLLLIVALVLLVDWAGTRKATTYGPTLIAEAADGRVWLVIDEDILIADANGALAGRVDVERTRIARPITALAALPGGGMLVGSRTTPRWSEVDATGAVGATVDLAARGAGAPFDSFKLAYSAPRDLVVLTDTSNHRLLALRRDGSVALADETARIARGLFRFPNGVLFARDGEIVVVNTNRHGLVGLGPQLVTARTIAVCDRCSGPYRWPAMLAEAPDGSYYVTVLDGKMETGAVVRVARDGSSLAAPALTADAEPTALVARRDDLLVSDQGRYRILRFDHDGNALADFGDAQIAGALAAAQNARSAYGTLTIVAQAALVLILPVLLWAYRREQDRAESSVAADGTLALPPPPGFGLRLLFATLFAFSLVFLIGGQVVLFGWIVRVASYGLPGLRAIAVTLIELVVFLLISFCAAAGLAHFSLRGRFAPLWQWIGARLWNRHAALVRRYLAAGDNIVWRGLAVRGKRLCLVALTPSRLCVVGLSGGTRVRSVQQGARDAISGVTRTLVTPRWWRRLVGAVPVFAVRFGIGRDDCELRFFDDEAAAQFASALGTTAATTRVDADGLTVATPADGGADSGLRSIPVWRQVVLAALVPGLGQLVQGRLWTGILFFTALGVNVIAYLRPIVAYFRRTMDVSPRILTAAFVTMGLIWLVSLVDAYVYARRDSDRN
jgi:hypothetical protein